jgi:hypothetical protein
MCAANSTRLESFGDYAKYEWIQGGRYFKENNTVYALTHMEWDCKNAETCPYYGYQPPLSFFSAVTLMVSTDGGGSWAHARPPPQHLVAAQPVRWNVSVGGGPNYGFRSPSGVVEARDGSGWFYATVSAGWDNAGDVVLGQQSGTCMMRTRDLTDPAAWRAWGGSTYDVVLSANPYTDPAIDPARHICAPFTRMTYNSLVWSSFYKQYDPPPSHFAESTGSFAATAQALSWRCVSHAVSLHLLPSLGLVFVSSTSTHALSQVHADGDQPGCG